MHESLRREWTYRCFLQSIRYPRTIKSSSHCTNPHRGNNPSSDLSINAHATFPRGGRLGFRAAGASPRPTTVDHRKSHAVCSGLITFSFKISDIRKEFGARATARAVQKTVAPLGKRGSLFVRVPVRSHLNQHHLLQQQTFQEWPHRTRSAGAQG